MKSHLGVLFCWNMEEGISYIHTSFDAAVPPLTQAIAQGGKGYMKHSQL